MTNIFCIFSTTKKWVSAYGQCGVNAKIPKTMFEVSIDWVPEETYRAYSAYRSDYGRSSKAANVIIGFGTEKTQHCGNDKESCGYRSVGTGNNGFEFGQITATGSNKGEFVKGDIICVALNFEDGMIQIFKNGKFFIQASIPKYLTKDSPLLYPTITFKECRLELNFGELKTPCKWLQEQGFRCLEDVAKSFGIGKKDDDKKEKNEVAVDWSSEYIIDELWVDIFEYLLTPQIFGVSFVCKRWHKLIVDYNIMERSEIYCYFSKQGLKQSKILGIGLSIKESEVGFQVLLSSQMDILSLDAWNNGCRIGVWGEKMTHFLPLAMNRKHCEDAHDEILRHLRLVCKTYKSIEMKSYHGKERAENPNGLERAINKSESLQMVDTLVTMMNKFVVEFVTGNKDIDASEVNCVMCEKMVLGYCALHHLLLYLQSKNKKEITSFANRTIEVFKNQKNGCNKWNTRDLGKVLIYLMISSKYQWSDIASRFIEESFTRRTRWFVSPKKHDGRYAQFDTTKFVQGRVGASFQASATGRKLVMFQVWFLKNSMNETLHGYNQRLGRPTPAVRNGVVAKAKYIMSSLSYVDYYKDLDFNMYKSYGYASAMDQMLRFAVWNSYCLGYHYKKGLRNWEYAKNYQRIEAPKVVVGGMMNRNRVSLNKKTKNNAAVRPRVNLSNNQTRPIRPQRPQQRMQQPRQQVAIPMATPQVQPMNQPQQQQSRFPRPIMPRQQMVPQSPSPMHQPRPQQPMYQSRPMMQPMTQYPMATQQPMYRPQPQQFQPMHQAQRPMYQPTNQPMRQQMPQRPRQQQQQITNNAQVPQQRRNPIPTQSTPQQVAQPTVNMNGRAKQPVSNKATVNGTKGLSKAQKRRLRTQRMMNGVKAPKKQLPVVSKQTPTTKAKSVQSTPSLSAETPIQTPMQAPIQFQSRSHITTTDLIELDADTKANAKNEPKLSKAQKRKLRMQKRKNGVVQQQTPSICSSAGPTKPPMRNNSIKRSGPVKPPMSNNKSKAKASKPAGKSEPKLSKAQKRKMRKNKMKNAA